jgi:hypothetical protein
MTSNKDFPYLKDSIAFKVEAVTYAEENMETRQLKGILTHLQHRR